MDLKDMESTQAQDKYIQLGIEENTKKGKIERPYDISIIVCDYNPKKKPLCYTLDSVINQKWFNYEIIIVDDGSKNNLHEITEDYFHQNCFLQLDKIP